MSRSKIITNQINQNDIIKVYQEEFSIIAQDFPLTEEQLYSQHKAILLHIKQQFNIKEFSNVILKNLVNEYSKIYEQNEQIYLTILTTYLDDEFDPINNNIVNNSYKNIDEYINDVKLFEEKINGASSQCPIGPNMDLHINKYLLEQILNDYEILFSYSINEYDIKLNDKKNEINDISNEIKPIQNECKKILRNIKENENIIKRIESDKNYILKQTTSNTDKVSKTLKLKCDMINKLNQEIENIENKNNNIISELKQKIKNSEQNKLDKEKIISDTKNEFEHKKIELQTKIDLLEKQIQNINQARTKALKSLTYDLLNNTQNSEIKKFEEQLTLLNKKIEKLTNKNNELSMELLEKDKMLENEKNKSMNIINEYEKKIKQVTDDHEYIEEKANEIQNEENNKFKMRKITI